MEEKKSQRLGDHFEKENDFELLLKRALGSASQDKEKGFLESLEGYYKQYGKRMFLSEKQLNWVRNIANQDPWQQD